MSECGVCKSKIKSLLYCNGCFQRAKSVAERRGCIQELRLQVVFWKSAIKELNCKLDDVKANRNNVSKEIVYFGEQIILGLNEDFKSQLRKVEKRLLELEKGELK